MLRDMSMIAAAEAGRVDSCGLVARPRLVERLLAARARPLAILVAPAGYGKSTLLREWEAADPRHFAWLPPGGAHTRPGRLQAAIGRALAEHGDGTVLVLDDAHLLQRRSLLAALPELIDRLDPGSQVVLASRAEPALPLGGWRARRMLVELRAPELAMTVSEAAELLQGHGVAIEPPALDLLMHRTEGWPAALYLAALAAGDVPQPGRTLTDFDGNDRFVADYLTDEMLAPLSSELAGFLTRTSVLDRLSGPLCDHVLGRSDSARQLKRLSRMNLMLVPLDRSDDEYRYHRLFAEALHCELRRSEPGRERLLHERASAWYERHGDTDRAIEHAIAARDLTSAGDLLWSQAAAYSGHGRSAELDGWLARFTDEQLAGSPTLALTAAARSLLAGQRDLVEHWSSAALGALEGRDGRALGGEARILRASVQGGSVTPMGEAAAAGSADAAEDSPWRALGCLLEGVARHLTGEREPARQLLEEGARRGSAAAPHLQALCLAQLGLLALERQDWAAADSLAARARAQVERAGLREQATSALVYAVAAHIKAHGGRVESAQDDMRQALDLLSRTDLSPWYEAECAIALARAAVRLGEAAQAQELLARAAAQLERCPDATVPRRWVDECRAQAELSSASAHRGWSLTTAELRVLQFLPTHLSFPEMAERLYVSANTVKTHARSVYRKLGASSRGEAVVRARDAGLLDQASHAGVGAAGLAGVS
jgi:LuxR family transcriptional regulator, maltose regulon positive regulatory protein